ncbi:hypothetical protein TNCV_2310241 [Trichonephila clavipes]|nr:hypothetical protein TNCV_2310241 [Trichonephila clavipes]
MEGHIPSSPYYCLLLSSFLEVLTKKLYGRIVKDILFLSDYSPYSFPDSPLVSMEVPLRTAYGQNGRYGMQPKARKKSSRAGAAKTRTETCELVEEKQKLLDIREKRTREVREQALPSAYHCQTYLPF